jgi:hypothetical protein
MDQAVHLPQVGRRTDFSQSGVYEVWSEEVFGLLFCRVRELEAEERRPTEISTAVRLVRGSG